MLRRYWPLIGIVAIVAAVAAFALTLTRPISYSASATMVAAPPAYFWRFAPAIQSQLDTRKDWRDEFIPLATDPDVINAVIEQTGNSLPAALHSREALLSRVQVVKGDGNQITLTASGSDPQQAADLANAWTKALVAKINQLYGPDRDSANFTQALQQARDRLNQADLNLRTFKAEHGIDLAGSGSTSISAEGGIIYSNQGRDKQLLTLKNSLLAEYRQTLDNLNIVIAQAAAAATAGQPATTLSLELLDTAILQRRGVITPDNVRTRPASEVAQALQAEKAAIEPGYQQLSAETQKLQADFAAELLDLERLYREQAVAFDAVSQLERKLSELRAQAVVEDVRVTQVSTAQAPVGKPAGFHPLRNAALGGVLGLIFGGLLALLLDYLSPKPQAAA